MSAHDSQLCGLDAVGELPQCPGCRLELAFLGPHFRVLRSGSRFQRVLSILHQLNDVRTAGDDRWTATCPACTGVLHVEVTSSGSVILDCTGGCNESQIVPGVRREG